MGWIYRAKTAEYQAGHLAKQYAWLKKKNTMIGALKFVLQVHDYAMYDASLAVLTTDGDVGRKAAAHRGAVWGRRRFWREGTEGLLGRLGSADELPVDGLAGGELHAWTENGGDGLDDGRLLSVSWQARRGRIRLGR
jgi:hypothetical protein